MFHYLQTQMESYLEMMTVEKRKIRIWSKRAHLALRAYQVLRGEGCGCCDGSGRGETPRIGELCEMKHTSNCYEFSSE